MYLKLDVLVFLSFIIPIVFNICHVFSHLTPDLVNIKSFFKLDACFDKISSQELKCHEEYLDSIDEITRDKGPYQESDQYKKLVCCSLWDYFDCILMSALDKCDQKDVSVLQSFPSDNNIYTAYCIDYQFGTYRCWKFPLWAVIICIIVGVLVITAAAFGIWFWKSNKITYWRYRRRY